MKTFFLFILNLGFLLHPPSRKAPAGTQTIPGLSNVFLDQREITNNDWSLYLENLQERFGEGSDKILNAQPDSVIWKLAYPEAKKYPHYPVVGISFEQAKNYCEWRSILVSQKEKRNVTFRLPSFREYKLTRPANENPVAAGLYSTGLGFRGFVGICDNAAEMLSSEGLAISGGNSTCLDSVSYFSPQPNLGFRCMAVLE